MRNFLKFLLSTTADVAGFPCIKGHKSFHFSVKLIAVALLCSSISFTAFGGVEYAVARMNQIRAESSARYVPYGGPSPGAVYSSGMNDLNLQTTCGLRWRWLAYKYDVNSKGDIINQVVVDYTKDSGNPVMAWFDHSSNSWKVTPVGSGYLKVDGTNLMANEAGWGNGWKQLGGSTLDGTISPPRLTMGNQVSDGARTGTVLSTNDAGTKAWVKWQGSEDSQYYGVTNFDDATNLSGSVELGHRYGIGSTVKSDALSNLASQHGGGDPTVIRTEGNDVYVKFKDDSVAKVALDNKGYASSKVEEGYLFAKDPDNEIAGQVIKVDSTAKDGVATYDQLGGGPVKVGNYSYDSVTQKTYRDVQLGDGTTKAVEIDTSTGKPLQGGAVKEATYPGKFNASTASETTAAGQPAASTEGTGAASAGAPAATGNGEAPAQPAASTGGTGAAPAETPAAPTKAPAATETSTVMEDENTIGDITKEGMTSEGAIVEDQKIPGMGIDEADVNSGGATPTADATPAAPAATETSTVMEDGNTMGDITQENQFGNEGDGWYEGHGASVPDDTMSTESGISGTGSGDSGVSTDTSTFGGQNTDFTGEAGGRTTFGDDTLTVDSDSPVGGASESGISDTATEGLGRDTPDQNLGGTSEEMDSADMWHPGSEEGLNDSYSNSPSNADSGGWDPEFGENLEGRDVSGNQLGDGDISSGDQNLDGVSETADAADYQNLGGDNDGFETGFDPEEGWAGSEQWDQWKDGNEAGMPTDTEIDADEGAFASDDYEKAAFDDETGYAGSGDEAEIDTLEQRAAEADADAAADATNNENATAPGATEIAEEEGFMDKVKEALFGKRTITYNYAQYALLIIEALKANEIKDATKEVKIKGADGLGGSQGSSNSTSGTQTTPSTVLNGTTLGDSITAMIELLRTNTIDISLLSEDFEQKKETTTSTGPAASISSGGSASQTGTETGTVPTTPDSDNGEDEDSLTTEQEAELRKRRVLMAMEWAVAAQQIGEGSNAISSKFYDRAATFVSAANAANGSLGGISTINDTDRFVLFELTRGAALSAMQLGLQASTTLSETKVKIERSEADSGSSGGADSSVSASSSGSQ